MDEISVILNSEKMDSADNIRRIKEQAKLPKPIKKYSIPKKSAKKLKQEAEEKKEHSKGGGSELDRWFQARRKEMQGVCLHCGEKTTKHQDNWYKCSIAHLLPKRLFKSIATHPLNWIELCFWTNNCHARFDTFTLDIIELNCYDLVIERFVAMYPDIDPKERKYIPEQLRQYINTDI
jgi:hypothetical protein